MGGHAISPSARAMQRRTLIPLLMTFQVIGFAGRTAAGFLNSPRDMATSFAFPISVGPPRLCMCGGQSDCSVFGGVEGFAIACSAAMFTCRTLSAARVPRIHVRGSFAAYPFRTFTHWVVSSREVALLVAESSVSIRSPSVVRMIPGLLLRAYIVDNRTGVRGASSS